MDAVWSSVVVMLAFTATFMALESGNRTATRDIQKTTAYDVAQDELASLRDLGKKDLNALLDKNNTIAPPGSPSKTVTLNGSDYDIWYSAYYVTGLGNNSTDACGGSYSGNGQGAAKFIYIKVTVGYEGKIASAPYATLDEYFAPEGGDTNAATGTLRTYLLKPPFDSPWTGVNVSLVATGSGMNFTTQSKTTGSSGCVLFTGLPRGQYNIQVTTSKYDIYLANPTGSLLTVPVTLPDRAAMSKDIRMDSPVKALYEYWTTTDNGTPLEVIPTTSTTSGPPSYVGSWVARSGKILQTSGTDFTTLPGTSFLPHTWLPSYGTQWMYPDPSGYDTFAGPCDVNEPAATEHIPTTGNATWTPGGTYLESGDNPRFELPQLRTRVYIANPAAETLIKDKQIRNNVPGGARQLVKLVGPANGARQTNAVCGPRANLFNTWQRMKGTFYYPLGATSTTSTPAFKQYLNDDSETLPTGKYDVCLQAYVSYSSRTWNGWAYSAWTGQNQYRYKLFSDVDIDSSTTLTWDPFSTDYTTTDCSGGASWSP